MSDLRNYWTPERKAADPWGYRLDLAMGALLPVAGCVFLLAVGSEIARRLT
jgi:hypothetical protein